MGPLYYRRGQLCFHLAKNPLVECFIPDHIALDSPFVFCNLVVEEESGDIRREVRDDVTPNHQVCDALHKVLLHLFHIRE